jgi:very-short-patch-repair endonuclease
MSKTISLSNDEKQLYLMPINAPLCACGCGNYVNWNKQKKKWSKYLPNHILDVFHKRSVAKTKEKKMLAGDPPLCLCGCGLPVTWQIYVGWNTYIHNHHAGNKDRRNKASLSMRKKHEDPEYKEKHKKAIKQSYENNPELRKIRSQSMRKRYSDPLEREKTSRLIKLAYEENPILRENLSKIVRKRCRDHGYIRKWVSSLNKSPNIPEALLIALTPEQIEYVGGGKFWRALKIRTEDKFVLKYKNPDFLVKGQKKVIEFNGTYWHRNDYPDEIWHEAWAGIGYQVLIIWEHELKDIDRVLGRIGEFIGQKQWQMSLKI